MSMMLPGFWAFWLILWPLRNGFFWERTVGGRFWQACQYLAGDDGIACDPSVAYEYQCKERSPALKISSPSPEVFHARPHRRISWIGWPQAQVGSRSFTANYSWERNIVFYKCMTTLPSLDWSALPGGAVPGFPCQHLRKLGWRFEGPMIYHLQILHFSCSLKYLWGYKLLVFCGSFYLGSRCIYFPVFGGIPHIGDRAHTASRSVLT